MLYVCMCIHIYIKREIYYKILALAVMDVEKSHCLPSTSWRSRKAVDAIQRFESWRAGGADFNLGLNI